MKKKILFFVPLPPPVTGAALRNKSLVDSVVLNGAFDIRVIPFNFATKVNDIGKFSFQKIYKFFARACSIVKAIFVFKPDLVYFNFSLYGFALYRDFVYVLIFKIFRCRLLFHLRTQGVKMQVRESKLKCLLFTFVFRNTQIICLSEYLSKDIEDVYTGEVMIVNNGIKDVSQQYQARPARVSPTVNIMFLGHLWVFKGINDLIQAFAILKEEGLPFHGTVVGPEGDIAISLLKEKVTHLGLSNHVDVVGPKVDEEKHQLFLNADIFVLPTHFEAFPGVLLEAMQFSLPVVATFEGAIPEIVENGVTGFLVQKKNPEDLAAHLRKLIEDSNLRTSMGHKGRNKFVKQYRVELFEQHMKSAFESALAR